MFEYNPSNWGDLDDSDEHHEFQYNNEVSVEDSQELPEVTVEEEKEFRKQFDKLIPTRGCISTGQKSFSTGNLASSNPTISSKTLMSEKSEKSDKWIRNAKILRSSSTTDMNKNVYIRKRRPKRGKDQKVQKEQKEQKNDTKISLEDSIEKSKSFIGKPIMENSSWADVVRYSN